VRKIEERSGREEEEEEEGEEIGEVEMTPIQHWFFEQNLADSHHWNQSLLLEARVPVSPALLRIAIESILAHHDALRMRYERTESGWRQQIVRLTDSIPFMAVDLSELLPEKRADVLQSIAPEVQASLNLSEGPVMRVISFHLGAGESSRILIVIHHLVIDAVSWRVILEDLQSAYIQLERNERPVFPAKTTSLRKWSRRLLAHAGSEEVVKEIDHWISKPRNDVTPLPVDFEGGLNILANTDIISVALNEEETRSLLEKVPAAYNTQINDALLAALALAFKRWTGQAIVLVDLEGHGREEIFQNLDLSRTVGWFTTRFPVLLDLRDTSTPAEALIRIKEMLRNTPMRGIGYGLLRYLKGEETIAQKLRDMPQPEISFNYFGQLDQIFSPSSPFGPAVESAGPSRSPRGKRRHLLVINGQVAGSIMQFGWRYATDVHRRETIEALANGYIDALRSLIEHCLSPQAGGYTASDFADFGWSQAELDNIIATIGKSF
jgi:non-ribosomal peptide synthase protein (TIGR01720 family)